MQTTRHNHVPSNYVIRSIEIRDEDQEMVFSYPKYDEVPLEEILKSADAWVITGKSPVASVIEIEEQICIGCGETCVRAERELVVFALSPDDAERKILEGVRDLLGGNDRFKEFLELEQNESSRESAKRLGMI